MINLLLLLRLLWLLGLLLCCLLLLLLKILFLVNWAFTDKILVHDILQWVLKTDELVWGAKLCEWIIFLHFHILHRFIYLLVLLQTFFILHTFFEKLFERSEEIERVLFKLHAWEHLWLIFDIRFFRVNFAVLIVIICSSQVALTRRIDLYQLLLQVFLKRGAIVCPLCRWFLLCHIAISRLHLLLSIRMCFLNLFNVVFVINKRTWVRLATLLLHFILEWHVRIRHSRGLLLMLLLFL